MTKKQSLSLIKLVNLLNDGQYHDGTTLGEQLKMTRSAVWKSIKKLENYDVEIHSVKGKGYALMEPLILLDIKKIKKQLVAEKVEIKIFESLPSTNDYLTEFKSTATTQICLAEQQTQGKGRLNREWHSPFGKNIYLSCLYRFQKDMSELSGLSLVTSLAIFKTLKQCGITDNLHVKWPNDLLFEGKKIAGSLIEVQAEAHGACQAIIGIGMNVNMLNDKSHRISQAWTSMQKILNDYVDRNTVCATLINCLFDYLKRFDAQGFAAFTTEWMEADCLAHRLITVKNLNDKIEGKVTGINEQGHLILQLADGSVRAFSSGDTSIVK